MSIGDISSVTELWRALVCLHPKDNIALAKIALSPGTILAGEPAGRAPARLTVQEPIPPGHKIALVDIEAGEPVYRYGETIGVASRAIRPGEHVHTHNLALPPVRLQESSGFDISPVEPLPEDHRRTFLGYLRADGRVGTRNYIVVLPTVSCAAHVARAIAHHFGPDRLAGSPNVDGVIALTHDSGCSIRPGGPEYTWLQRTLAGIARHPNVGGCVLIGLGCEVNQLSELVENYQLTSGTGNVPVGLVIQELGGTARTIQAGIAAIERLLPVVNACQRQPQPISGLTLALQCGGSDSWSGVTANPLVGLVADQVVRQGGTVVLAETPEIYGAEHLLTRRAVNQEVAARLLAHIRWWEAYTRQQGTAIDNNPTPGNKAGGLTNIVEKALGAVAKAGHTPLVEVYDYAEQIRARGLVFMNTPGNDLVSVTGQVAGGCNLALFTTGRGTVVGFKPAPVIKIASNTAMYDHMRDDMDFNAGRGLEGASLEELAGELLNLVIEIASGQPSRSEMYGAGEAEFSPWRYGEMV